jgi:undecaprenyl-diphosphatase
LSARIGEVAAASWLRHRADNWHATLATLTRRPRRAVPTLDRRQLALIAAAAVAAALICMVLLDAWALDQVNRLPPRLVEALNRLTDMGRAGFFLWPIGFVLLALALMDHAAAPRFARLILAAWTVRLGFVFLAIGVPGFIVAVVKRLIGRARPLIDPDVWSYHPFNFGNDYASLPSGHATTACAALVAIGALFPQARPLMRIYAVLVLASRVALASHHPSDVLLGGVVGAVGALMVRDWFAARSLGFVAGADGRVRPLPGPRMGRIIEAIGRCLRAFRSVAA